MEKTFEPKPQQVMHAKHTKSIIMESQRDSSFNKKIIAGNGSTINQPSKPIKVP